MKKVHFQKDNGGRVNYKNAVCGVRLNPCRDQTAITYEAIRVNCTRCLEIKEIHERKKNSGSN